MNTHSEPVDAARSALGQVRLSEPNARWAALFEIERHRLTSIRANGFQEIAHFGSTAVPGMRAKPIIDIMASVAALSAVDVMLPALKKLGYEPAEIGFLKRRFLRKPAASSGVGCHLHIVTSADWPSKNELMVRDWLLAHPDVARCYGLLKEALARDYPQDMPAYTAAKSAFLRDVVNDARRSKGLPPQTDWTE